jgi:uncharacterized protein YidB (DUF937 family)
MGLLDGALGGALGSVLGAGNTGNLQGMLGGLLGQLGGAQGGAQGSNASALLTTAMALLQQHGGLEGIVAKFRENGLGSAVDSWVGTGANAPVTGSQITQVLGESTVQDVATKLGVDPAQASGGLASMLPELVNQLTPNGHIPANSGDMLTQGLAMLKAQLGS